MVDWLHRGPRPGGVVCVQSNAHPTSQRQGGDDMSLIDFSDNPTLNPLDVVERVAATNGWSFERAGEDEITLLVTGKWTDYQVSFTWMHDIEALHLACAFDLKIPDLRLPDVQQLVAMINEQLWIGHFDLWTTDGTTGQGRVWKISPIGAVTEMFRVQPMSNEVNLVNGVGGVGRDVHALPPGAITVTPTSRNAANALGSVPIVANGLQFTSSGDLLVADTARGAIWKVRLQNGQVVSNMGCDTTFTANTLCLDNVLVQHPSLEGIDGFVLDSEGNVWADANERQAVIFINNDNGEFQIKGEFRNAPDPATLLRNLGPLEFPTSPVLAGNTLCTSNTDIDRRDNSPSTGGEISPAGPARGKISCLNSPVPIRGATLPVQ